MDLTKSIRFFDPAKVDGTCHIIGCGSVGSTIAELLARLGVRKMKFYDFDSVSAHNIANQMFFNDDIGRLKVDAVKDMVCRINPELSETVEVVNEGWTDATSLDGYVFLCVDNIELRRQIVEKNQLNFAIKVMFDFRTRLTDAQHYAAEWGNLKGIRNLMKSMSFSHAEADAATPRTACNVAMGVAPTVRIICSYGVSNFVNYITTKKLVKTIIADAFNFTITTI